MYKKTAPTQGVNQLVLSLEAKNEHNQATKGETLAAGDVRPKWLNRASLAAYDG